MVDKFVAEPATAVVDQSPGDGEHRAGVRIPQPLGGRLPQSAGTRGVGCCGGFDFRQQPFSLTGCLGHLVFSGTEMSLNGSGRGMLGLV